MIEEILAEAGEKMEKTIEATKTEFAKVRTGRVNPAIFSGLTADYYGARPPLQQLVSFNVEDARTVKDRSLRRDRTGSYREGSA